MNPNKFIQLLSKQNRVIFFIQTVIPFALPFVLEIPDNLISIWIKIPFLLLVAYIDLKLIFLLDENQKDDIKVNFENQVARYAYSSVYELNERKRDYLITQTSHLNKCLCTLKIQ